MHSPPLFAVMFAVLMYAISVSPSLLPRRWWYHGLVSGVLMSVGYTLGWVLSNVGVALFNSLGIVITANRTVVEVFPWLVGGIFGIWAVRSIVLAHRSSWQAALVVQMRPVRPAENLLGLLASILLFAILTGVGILFVQLMLLVHRWLAGWIYGPISFVLAVIFSVLLVIFISDKVVFRGILAFFAREAAMRNNRTVTGVFQPHVSERSGSPASLCSWSSVGAQGRTFLGSGPSKAQIEAVTGQPAEEPIRIYVGLPEGGADFEGQAQIVVEEMRRTGAFNRRAILISVATGSGWVDEWGVQPLEYLTRGNCATVSMQYSYLFSAAVLVTEMDVCRNSAVALFEAVRNAIDALPAEKRPRLFIGGESLGAEAAQYPFEDFRDLTKRVDGAVLVGSPANAPVLNDITTFRHRGSPEVTPVYDSGRNVRVVGEPRQLEEDIYGREYGKWDFPRIVFAQHATDPVVWFSTKLLFNEPDWLRERASLAVSPNMRYTYLVTFWQVACDLPMAGLVPAGHGHTYHEELIPIWVKVLGIGEGTNPDSEPFVPEADASLQEKIGLAIAENIAK